LADPHKMPAVRSPIYAFGKGKKARIRLRAVEPALFGSQMYSEVSMSQTPCLIAIVPILALGASNVALAANAPAKEQLIYTVQHSKYGKIGTYTNTIEHQGDITNVTTTAKLTVLVLGVNMYRQDISRHETWRGNRIIDFHGVTTENGKTIELSGKAEGNHFAMMTPNGRTTAPADVRVANPWSRQAVDGNAMLTLDRGRLETVTVASKAQATLNIGHRPVRTERIQVLRNGGASRYEVWLDEKGTPVQFSIVGEDTVTFKLAI